MQIHKYIGQNWAEFRSRSVAKSIYDWIWNFIFGSLAEFVPVERVMAIRRGQVYVHLAFSFHTDNKHK